MPNVRTHDGEVELEEYHRDQLELAVTARLTLEDLVNLITDLPQEQQDYFAMELAKELRLASELFERQSSDDQVDIAYDHLDLTQVEELLGNYTDAERKELFDAFCIHCGSTDSPCYCMRDE